jgi:deaminated glutathione amidase
MGKASVVQLASSTDVGQNLGIVEQLIKKCKACDSKLVVLPENFAFMGENPNDKLAIAENYGAGPIQDRMSQLAQRYDIWIIAGTQAIKQPGCERVRTSSIVYDNQGNQVNRYDKIHLFDVRVSKTEVHTESITVEPGNQVVTLETPVGIVGLSVCYDLRFPKLYNLLRESGAELFIVPAAFTAITGVAHWNILLRARAIENLCYVLASNQGGTHKGGRKTYGNSAIIEPWGKILKQADLGDEMLTCDIDLTRLHKMREQFPCNEHHVL